MKKKILSVLLTLTMVIGIFSTGFAVPSDIMGTDYEDAVVRLEALGVLSGYPDGSFRPNNDITRAEYASAVTRAKGLEQDVANSNGITVFDDVPTNFWAAKYIDIAEKEGLIAGFGIVNGKNNFKPQDNIKYEQAIAIILRAIGYEPAVLENGGWPNGYLIVAEEVGLLEDVNGSLGQLAKRGLVAQLTYNALEIPNMIKVGSDYIVSGTQGTDEVFLFNELHMINAAAASGNWGNIDKDTFALGGITGVTAGNLANFKATLENLADGENQNWSPEQIQGVFDTIVSGEKVISAKAINSMEVQIKFNVELDPFDAITTAPYKVSISGVTFVGTPVLSGNGKTLTLKTSSPMNLNSAALVVEPIRTEDNASVKTDRYTALYSYTDTEDPDIAEVISKTNTNTASKLTVKFTESVQSLGTIKIDGATKAATGFTSGDMEARFTGLSLDASQSHTIEITNLKDRASNVSGTINKSFNVIVDTVKPTVSLSRSMDRDNVIVFEFDKPITTSSANSKLVNGIVKNEMSTTIASSTAVAVNPMNGLAEKYEMAVNAPFSSLATRNLTVVLPTGIEDELGNQLVATSKSITLNKDVTAPEIEAVNIVRDSNENVLSLTLRTDSTLSAKAAVLPIPLDPKVTVSDPGGSAIDTTTWLGGLGQDMISAGDKEVTLSFVNPGKLSGVHQFTFAADMAKDQADSPNDLKSKSISVDFGAPTSTGSFAVVSVTSGGPNIYNVDFGSPVRGGNVGGSATDLANYTLDANSLPGATTITLNPAKTIAKITLPPASVVVDKPAAVLAVNNVERLTGETNTPYTAPVVMLDNIEPVMNSAVLTTDNKMVVGFTETLSALPTPADFEIKVNGKTLLIPSVFVAGAGSDAGKYVFDFTPLILTNGTEVYVDMNADAVYTAAIDALDAPLAGVIPPNYQMINSAGITSVTIKVIGNATTDNSTLANTLKVGTMITIK